MTVTLREARLVSKVGRFPVSRGLRPALMLLALLLAAAGQWLVNTNSSHDLLFGLGGAFDTAFRVQLRNPDTTLSGLFLLLCGSVAFAFAAPSLESLDERPFDAPLPARRNGSRWGVVVFATSCTLWLALVVTLAGGKYSHWFVVALALFVGGIVIPARRYLRPAEPDAVPGLGRPDVFVLSGLVVGAAVVLFRALDSHPMMLLGDEGIFLENSKSLSENWMGNALGVGTYSYPALGGFYQALVLRLLGASVWSWRFSSALASLAAVPLFYLLFRQTFSRLVTSLAVVLCVGSPYFLAVSRMGYYSNHTIPIVTLFLVLLQRAALRRDQGLFLMAGLASGLGFLTYPPAKVSVVIGCVLLVLMFLSRRMSFRQTLTTGLIFAAGTALLAIPQIVTSAAMDPVSAVFKLGESMVLNTWSLRTLFPEVPVSQVWTILVGDQTLFFEPRIAAILIVRGVVRTLLLFHDHAMIGQQYMITGMVGFFAAPFYLLGLGYAARRVLRRPFTIPVLLYVSCFLCLSVLNVGGDRHSHLLPIVSAAALFVALPLVIGAECFPSRLRRVGEIGATVVAAAIAFWGCYTYYGLMPRVYRPTLDAVIAHDVIDGPHGVPIWFVTESGPREPWQDLGWTRFMVENLHLQGRFEALSIDQLRQRLHKTAALVVVRPELEEELHAMTAGLISPAPRLEPIDIPGTAGPVRIGYRMRFNPPSN